MSDQKLKLLPYSKGCYVCCRENPIGLKLKLFQKDNMIYGTYTAKREYQGYEGMLHGGFITTLLDEALAWTPMLINKGFAVTGEIIVKFIKPVPIETEFSILSWVNNDKGRYIESEAHIKNSSGQILAKAVGKLFPLPDQKIQEFKKSIVE